MVRTERAIHVLVVLLLTWILLLLLFADAFYSFIVLTCTSGILLFEVPKALTLKAAFIMAEFW